MSFITDIIGGIQGADASHNAAGYLQQGNAAAGNTVQNAATQANAGIGSAASAGIAGIGSAAQTGMSGITGAAGNAGTGALYAAGQANQLQQPYIAGGQQGELGLQQFMAPGGRGATPFDASMMEANDPGYQFRLQQGQQALDRAAAAHGAVMGGGQLKALTDYAQGAASSEYQNAFNRYRAQNQDTFGFLKDMAGMGQQSAALAGGNMMNAAQYAGTTGLQGAEAAGSMGLQGALGAGSLGLHGALAQSGNTMGAGEYQAGTQIGAAQAHAAGDLGAAKAWSGMLGSLGTAGNQVLTGGWGSLLGGAGGSTGGGDKNGIWDPYGG